MDEVAAGARPPGARVRATHCLTALREPHGVRVNCVVPGWVATERARSEIAAPPPADRAGMAPLVELGTLCDQVVRLIEDDDAAGYVTVLDRGRSPRTLRPAS